MSLRGEIAIVTGASRGVGRGIALQLGEAGCTVYVTGRRAAQSLSNQTELPSLEKTAQEIRARGGRCIAKYVDHSDMDSVRQVFEEIDNETGGKIDILVNNAYSGVPHIPENMDKRFFESEPELWDKFNNVGLRNHYYCAVYAAKMMTARGRGLIVNVSSVGGLYHFFNVPYGVGKAALDRMTKDMADDLKSSNVCIMSIWPGAVKTELCMGAVESGPQGIGNDHLNYLFQHGESCEFVGKCIAHLGAEPNKMQFNGRILFTTDVAEKYKFKDIDGSSPLSYRSPRNLLTLIGRTRAASFFPQWLRVPGWVMTAWESTM